MNNLDTLFADIRRMAEELPDFGQLHFTLKKHVGTFNNTDAVKVTSYKFTNNDPNVTAATQIMTLIKAIQNAEETGQLSLNIVFKHGRAEQMQVQDFKKL